MSFPDKGAVADIDPAFFIGYLHRQGATGTLKFDDTPVQRAVYFRDGRILFSSSNAAEDQLGAILVAAGKISQQQFEQIVAALEPKQSIAAALAQGGHVSQRDIGDAARRKVDQIVASCCAQSRGSYEFENGVLPKGALDLKLTTERVLISAFENLEPSGFLNRILKSPMAVLAQGTADVTDPELTRIREALDGVSTLADVGGTVGLPLPATEARAAVLVVLGGASVVTSQIEEMSLPDTGENADVGLPSADAEGAETLAFVPPEESAGTEATMVFAQPPPVEGSTEATMVFPAAAQTSGDSEATLIMGSGLDQALKADAGSRGGGKRPDKASTQDLAAVKELLGSPTGSVPRPAAASIPSERWEPKLSAEGRPRGREKPSVLAHPAVRAGLLVVFLGVAGLLGWSYYTSREGAGVSNQAPATVVRATPASSTPAVPPSAPLATPAAAASAPASARGAVAPTATPTPAPTKAAVTPAPTAVPAIATKPSPTPTAAPAATPAKAVSTPASPPAPPVRTAPASGNGYDSLKAGKLSDAQTAGLTFAQSRTSAFSVQLLVACSPTTIEKALQNDASTELFVLPATISGKACHRLMRGVFVTHEAAAEALASIPPYYRAEGAKPQAIAISKVLR